MPVSNAQRVEDDGQHDCPVCDAEAPYVLYDDDKMCKKCGHTPGSGGDGGVTADDDEWADWRSHRREKYSGWFGPERVKFVGGFASAYLD